MEYTLELAFETADERRRLLKIGPARNNLTLTQAQNAATAIINSGVFAWSPVKLIGAKLVAQAVTTLL